MDKVERICLVSAILSLFSMNLQSGLLKLLFLPILYRFKSYWALYILQIILSGLSDTPLTETFILCLQIIIFPRNNNQISPEVHNFLILISWFFFAGFFTSDLTEVFPVLFSLYFKYQQDVEFSLLSIIESKIKETFDENRLYREKIEAYRKIASPMQSLSTSRRTSNLIKKLRGVKNRVNPTRSFTEISDADSNSSDADIEIGSKNSSGSNHHSFNSDIHVNQGITNEDIKDIINTLINQEYLMWNPDKCKDNEVDVMSLAIEAKNIYTQTIENLPGSSHRVIKIPKVRVKRIQSIRSMIEVSEALSNVLEGIGEWDFNCFDLIQITKDPAFEVGLYVFTILGLPDTFSIENQVLRNFLTAVEQGYNRLNFYHNSIHAADVTASTVFLMQKGLSRCGNLVDLDAFALVTSAICHDIGHPGVNNAFLVATSNDLALKYNDHSCLESMHANKTFTILSNDNCNITKNLPKADFQRFRKTVICAILATDLQAHFDKLNEFRTSLEKKLDLTDDKFRLTAMQMCLKCADIGHGAKKLMIHQQWTCLITKEFFRQGDLEAQAAIPVSALCDRSNCVISKSQVGFLEVLVKPLFKVWEEFVEQNNEEESELEVKICMQNIMENIEFWDNEFHSYQNGEPKFFLDNNAPPLGN